MKTTPSPQSSATPSKSPRGETGAGFSRLPSLDGWRAVSILLVLGAHTAIVAGFPRELDTMFQRVFDGHLGVRFFFVISGFLITWLMLVEENRTGTVNLKRFYLRRALRILPVYFAFLGVLALLQAFTPFRQGSLTWFGNLTFSTNYFNDNHCSNHLWSLAVEEQFYLIWPAAFVLFRPQASWKATFSILFMTCMLAVANRLVWNHPFSDSPIIKGVFSEWSFFNNADSLAIGCVAAISMSRAPEMIRQLLVARPWKCLATGVLLIGFPKLVKLLVFLPSFMQNAVSVLDSCAGRTIQSFGFALLMLHSIYSPQWGVYRLLNVGAFAQLGVLSYSIYIWQQLFCTNPQVFGLRQAWWMSYPLWLLPALLVAAISYYGLERPLIQLRNRFK